MNENKEKCGVLALVGKVSYTTDFLLDSLKNIQHRGRESFGICFKEDKSEKYITKTFMDLIVTAKEKMSTEFLSKSNPEINVYGSEIRMNSNSCNI